MTALNAGVSTFYVNTRGRCGSRRREGSLNEAVGGGGGWGACRHGRVATLTRRGRRRCGSRSPVLYLHLFDPFGWNHVTSAPALRPQHQRKYTAAISGSTEMGGQITRNALYGKESTVSCRFR